MSFGASQFRSLFSSLEKIVAGSDIENALSESISQIGPILNSLGVGNSNAVNISENADSIVVEIQIPGFDRTQLKLWVEGHMLFVACERAQSAPSNQTRFHQTEFTNKDYTRSIHLPINTDTSKVHASILRGILTVKFSKLPENEKIEIVIE